MAFASAQDLFALGLGPMGFNVPSPPHLTASNRHYNLHLRVLSIAVSRACRALLTIPYFQHHVLFIVVTMASTAKDRVNAIGKQLAPAVVETATYEGIPPIPQIASASNGPRAQGKVVIITGTLFWPLSLHKLEVFLKHLPPR